MTKGAISINNKGVNCIKIKTGNTAIADVQSTEGNGGEVSKLAELVNQIAHFLTTFQVLTLLVKVFKIVSCNLRRKKKEN